MVPAVVSWANSFTPLHFISSTLILGICGYLIYNGLTNQNTPNAKTILFILIGVIVLVIITSIIQYNILNKLNETLPIKNEFISHSYKSILIANLVLSFASITVLSVIVYSVFVNGQISVSLNYLYIPCLVSLMISVVLSRILFFGSFIRTGI